VRKRYNKVHLITLNERRRDEYYEGIKGRPKETKFNLRLKMVKLAVREGISESGRVDETTRVRVRKWLKRG
jgi:hypothetical protein